METTAQDNLRIYKENLDVSVEMTEEQYIELRRLEILAEQEIKANNEEYLLQAEANKLAQEQAVLDKAISLWFSGEFTLEDFKKMYNEKKEFLGDKNDKWLEANYSQDLCKKHFNIYYK